MVMLMKISLPWPPSELSPNKRQHWTKKSAAVAKYRELCHQTALMQAYRQTLRAAPYRVTILFVAPDRRRYDVDNLLARLKSGLDGVCDALKINDVQFRTIVIRRAVGIKVGSVDVVIEEDPSVDL
jgi:crossover junction endodeoxyribonuclease RusA